MDKLEMKTLLKETGALREGHFVLTSGLHSAGYVQCALLLKDPAVAEKVCGGLAAMLREYEADLVAGPALGGVICGYETARQLGIPYIFTERKEGVMTLRRGFSVEPGTKVLVIEDVITTGGSTQEVVDLLTDMGAEVVAAASIIDRSQGNEMKIKVPFNSLIKLEIPTFRDDVCPMCKEGLPVDKPGSRK